MFKEGSRALGYAVLGIAVLAVLTLIAILAFGGVSQLTAGFRGETDKKNRTVGSGAFRIATYEEFFDLCASAQAAEAAIKNAEKELDTEQPADRQAQLRQVITAQSNIRAEAITTYNSKATQEHRGAFQDADLPYKLDIDAEETQCAA
ncbi:hypothetical protein [Streptomyces sp. Amel2xC10]|uniref:hypothetical protein n=1 Tax=Streptomyces sp. Amel2xC10 TaxID=1305826 RepID=UPI000A08E787|nr:hypothetical protein [Streptomyces sp. Amel2xC10]SMF85977.1 hypothetical protein SAMN02745830_07096 [Streptomyces sp. Amel2xC10]